MWEDVYVSWQKERPRKNQGDCRKIGGVKEKADVQASAFFD